MLAWGVKLASVAITGPATWIVATALFRDVQAPALLFAMRFAAVFLIEGVMLSNWLLLEFDRTATPEIKARYGLTALAMYVALLIIAWEHEGPTGLVFRIALLAALLGSGWDTYVYTWQKTIARADKDISATGAVRRHARKLAEQDAKRQLDYEYDQRNKDRQLEHKEVLEQINHLANRNSENRSIRSNAVTPKPSRQQGFRRSDRRLNRALRLELGRSIIANNPELAGPEFVERLGVEIKARFGVRARISESTAYADFAALRSQVPELVRGNNGHSPSSH